VVARKIFVVVGNIKMTYLASELELVSTLHPDYEERIESWNYLEDLYVGSDRWLNFSSLGYTPTSDTAKYLPMFPGEGHENWVSRINATYYDDLFGKALRRYVDLVFQSGIVCGGDSDTSFSRNYEHLGVNGESGELLLRQAALSSLLYGHCFVMVDSCMPEGGTYGDAIANPPYWIILRPQDVINWDGVRKDNSYEYSLLVVKRVFYERRGFEHKQVIQYRVYCPGSCFVYEEGERKEISLICTYDTGLDFIPVVRVDAGYYPSSDFFPCAPFRPLADKNRTLYQMVSNHLRKVSLCCQPVAVLRDALAQEGDLVIGPNSYIHLRDPQGEFSWQEPLSLSLSQSMKDIQKLEASIANDMAQFLTTPSDRQSATASQLMVSPIEANLQSFIVSFCDGINRLISVHNVCAGTPGSVFISLTPDVFPDSNKDSQGVFAIANLYQTGIISRATTLLALQSFGVFPKGFDIEKEIGTNNGTAQ
jgi:hypothetical protein